uniref:(northern house mosquito) hypothetical protein n=1 Tax=Culex pipiens TaxID=7175 RepID=A0A8D8MBL7_CULPI
MQKRNGSLTTRNRKRGIAQSSSLKNQMTKTTRRQFTWKRSWNRKTNQKKSPIQINQSKRATFVQFVAKLQPPWSSTCGFTPTPGPSPVTNAQKHTSPGTSSKSTWNRSTSGRVHTPAKSVSNPSPSGRP